MTIVLSLPYFISGEEEKYASLLDSTKVDLIHIRKPHSTLEELDSLVRKIPAQYYNRIVLHEHFELAERYHLRGVHLNSRCPHPPKGWIGTISRSCHSIAEVVEWKPKLSYLSLSPIFDSISKEGYMSAFSKEVLHEAVINGIIDQKVLALGGVTFRNLPLVKEIGFGGGMILGDAWKEYLNP